MNHIQNIASLSGRVLIAAIFVISGYGKIGAYVGTQNYMEAAGVPGALLPVVIALEIGAGLLVIVGWQTRIAAFALACFSILAAVLFHTDFSEQFQFIMYMKNLAIAGGFLFLVANGAGPLSVDARRARARGA